ncbi:MAG: aminotransferase class I/II-fold pyridoxal phosphate-dependent enzyme [Calditrichia bacterium]
MFNKQKASDLAYLGGDPLFHEKLHVGAPNLGSKEALFQRIEELYRTKRLANRGPFVRELEARLAEEMGVKHCIAMCNGTIALEIAIRALGMSGEVILPSFTFIATAHALQWQEITPVFCDVEKENYTIDPLKVEALITPKTSGIIGVHLWARACKIEALQEIANHHNLCLLFDAAHAFKCSYKKQMIGSFGDAEVFSFHATKFFNTFEGGAIATNSEELAEKIRFMQNFGFVSKDQVDYLGINGKMSEISAAMGLTSLESVDLFVAVNKRNYQLYKQGLAGLSGVRLLSFSEDELSNKQYIVLEIDAAEFGLGRDCTVSLLESEGVLARRYFYPGCHQMEPYRSYFPNAGLLLPETERLAKRTLCLPTGMAIDADHISGICKLLHFFQAHHQEITAESGDQGHKITPSFAEYERRISRDTYIEEL